MSLWFSSSIILHSPLEILLHNAISPSLTHHALCYPLECSPPVTCDPFYEILCWTKLSSFSCSFYYSGFILNPYLRTSDNGSITKKIKSLKQEINKHFFSLYSWNKYRYNSMIRYCENIKHKDKIFQFWLFDIGS